MAMKILVAPAAKSKRVFPRRAFLKSLGAALAGASAVALLPAAVAAMPPGVIAPACDVQWLRDRIAELMTPEYGAFGSVVLRRAMTAPEVGEYLTLDTSRESVAFLDAMGAVCFDEELLLDGYDAEGNLVRKALGVGALAAQMGIGEAQLIAQARELGVQV